MISTDTICDVRGVPLAPDSVTLLKALDKLLTVGAYYSVNHDQYLLAARKSRDAIVGMIGGSRGVAAIDVTSQGLMIGQQNIDPHHRNVRLLHDLLVPLNIARLEIDGSLTPEELRQAITALQEHRLALGHASTFQEVVINNLPPSIRAVSRSVLHKAGGNEGGGKDLSLDELLDRWSDEQAPSYAVPESDSEQLARRFMDMVNCILGNLEEIERQTGITPIDPENGCRVTQEDLRHLKQALERLVEVDLDPADLLKLIDQAQQALDLSRDTRSVDLVFEILRKDMVDKSPERAGKREAGLKGAKSAPVEFRLTVEQIGQSISELEKAGTPVAETTSAATSNQLGICLHLLRSDPPRSLRTALLDQISRCVGAPGFVDNDLRLCAQAVESVARDDGVEGLDDLLPQITGVLRREHAGLTGQFWLELSELLGHEHLGALWPHLVNDLLLGFDKTPRETTRALACLVTSLNLPAAIAEGRRLEKQPAFQGLTASHDIFLAPLAGLHPLLTMLMTSPLKAWLSRELYRVLTHRPPTPLVEVVLAALGEYQPESTLFYLSLAGMGTSGVKGRELREQAAAVLHGALTALTGARRKETWVPRALVELALLEPELVRPIARQVLTQRRFIFAKAWPAPARAAATEAEQIIAREEG
jgi:hypothetical protein